MRAAGHIPRETAAQIPGIFVGGKHLQIGDQIGDYQIIGILGSGGMGRVYKVRNVISDRMEAMKVLLPDLQHETGVGDRFMREIKLQATLKHPNIAQLFTASRLDNQLLMFLEFLEGINVETALKAGAIPVAQAVDFMMQALSALEYAHDRGIIHRDIKPSNMMITPVPGQKGRVLKLMDFGIARAVDHALTNTGVTMGSIYYMSPEQVKGAKTLDARADIYSAGVSLYEMVTGRKAFDGDSSYEIMNAHVLQTPAAPRSINTAIPQELEAAILRAIAKKPEDRFSSAREFREALAAVPQSGPVLQPISLEPPTDSNARAATPRVLGTTVTILPVDKPPTKTTSPKPGKLAWGIGALAAAATFVAGAFFINSNKAVRDTPAPQVAQQAPAATPVPDPPKPVAPVQPSVRPAKKTAEPSAPTQSAENTNKAPRTERVILMKNAEPTVERKPGAPPRREAAGSEVDFPPPPERGRRGGPPPPGAPGGPNAVGIPDANEILKRFNMPPIPVFRPDPAYTDEARAAGIEGVVVLDLEVTADGTPQNLKVVKGLGMGLDEQAMKTLAQWRFRPALKDGKPVSQPFTTTLRFRLGGGRRDKSVPPPKPANQ